MKEWLISGDILAYVFVGGVVYYQHTCRKKTKLVLKKYEETLNEAVKENKNTLFIKEKYAILNKEEKEIFKQVENKLKQSNEAIYEFYRELTRHTSPENLRNFVSNIQFATLDINDSKKKKKCVFQSFYDQTKNKITIYTQLPETLTHDLLHLSSNNQSAKTNGFHAYGTFKEDSYEIGNGLDEGYTEILNQRYFQQVAINSPKLVRLSSLIEKFYQNPKDMETDYFNACLENLILELTKSMDIKDAINIVLKIDYVAIHPNDHIFYHKVINKLIELYRQSHKRQETKEFVEEAKKTNCQAKITLIPKFDKSLL